MQKTNNLQEIFLTQLRRERRPVTMFLMNGFQMRGYVTGFDAFPWSSAAPESRCSSISTPFRPSRRSAPSP